MRINTGIFLPLYALAIIGCQSIAPTEHKPDVVPTEDTPDVVIEFFNLEIGSSWDYILSTSYPNGSSSSWDKISKNKSIRLVGIETHLDSTIINFSVLDSMIEDATIYPGGVSDNLGDSSCTRLKRISGFECRESPYLISFLVTKESLYPLAYQGEIGFDLFLKVPIKLDSVIHRSSLFSDTKIDWKVVREVQWHGTPYYIAEFPNPDISPYANETSIYMEKLGLFSYQSYSGNHGSGITNTIKLSKFNGQEVVFSE